MAYILKAPNPSALVGGDVYYSEDSKWTQDKEEATKFSSKAKADAAKKAQVNRPSPINDVEVVNLNPRKTKAKK